MSKPTNELSRRGVLGGIASAAVLPLLSKSAAASPTTVNRDTVPGSRGMRSRVQHSAVTLAGGWILVTGGYPSLQSRTPLRDAQIYDPISDEWYNLPPMGGARARHALVALPDGSALAIGGVGEAGLLASVELYNPSNNSWRNVGRLSVPRADLVAVLAHRSVLITGGFTGSAERPITLTTEHFRLEKFRSAA